MAGKRLSKSERRQHKNFRSQRRNTRTVHLTDDDEAPEVFDIWRAAGVDPKTPTDQAIGNNGKKYFVADPVEDE